LFVSTALHNVRQQIIDPNIDPFTGHCVYVPGKSKSAITGG